MVDPWCTGATAARSHLLYDLDGRLCHVTVMVDALRTCFSADPAAGDSLRHHGQSAGHHVRGESGTKSSALAGNRTFDSQWLLFLQ